MQNKKAPQPLVSEVQLFRVRVAAAESQVKVLREQARQAKRRRKEAKRLAQRARKEFKRAKAALAELKEGLASAEAKLFHAGGRMLAKKIAKPRAAAKRAPEASTKPKEAAPQLPPSVAVSSSMPSRTKPKRPAPKKTETVSHADTSIVATNPMTVQAPDSNSKTYEPERRDEGQREVEQQKV
jgi:hypothetical protein